MGFIPISADDLKIGLYIKVDPGRSEHPFLQDSFKIGSQTDIDIIRKHGLWKISYDPALSDPEALEALASQSREETRVVPEKEVSLSEEVLEEATDILQQEKEKLLETPLTHQDTLKETEKAYRNALHQNRTALKMVSMGQSEGLALSKEIVRLMMDILQCPSPTLTLVNAPHFKDITEELSVHAINVCSLALLLGETLGLNQKDSQTLGHGALFHNIGLHQVPPALRMKQKDDLSPKERQLLEAYPSYGLEMVHGLHGISPRSLNIISHHQENLDGSGYPRGLKGTQIAFLPKVIRVVTEYNSLLNHGHGADHLTPRQVLTHLYTKMKEKCELDIIDAFIAMMTIYPPGSFVRLTDDSVGLVVKTNKSERLRPLVVLYETIQTSDDLVIIDLAKEQELSIKECLDPKDLDPKILTQLQQPLDGIKGYFVSS